MKKVGDIVINPYVSKTQKGKQNPMYRTMFLRIAGNRDIVCMDFNGKTHNFLDALDWEVVGNIDLKQLMLADGVRNAREDLVHCKDCHNWEYPVQIQGLKGDTSHIGMCELTGWLCGEQGYCMYGREVQDEID